MIKRTSLLAMLALLLASSTVAAKTRIYMFGGQSNMVGPVTDFSELPAELQYQPDNVTFWLDGRLKNFSDEKNFAAEVAFSQFAARMYPDDEIILVKRAVGGTPMACWMPVFDSIAVDTVDQKCTESLYPKWMADLAKARADDSSAVVEAVLWDQGGRDARYEAYAYDYYDRLNVFLDSLNADLANPVLQIIAGNVVARDAEWRDTVRAGQLQAMAERTNYHVINNDDLLMATDGKHFTNESQIMAGTRMALLYFGLNAPAGGSAPTVPDSITGRGLSGQEIKLNWSGSVPDSAGLKCYLIKRDGELADSTIYPFLIDRNLLNDTEYTYEIAAAGLNGSVSAYSAPVTVKTLDVTGQEPYAWWTFDSSLVDSGLNSCDGLWKNDTAYVTGIRGAGVHMDGSTTGPYVKVIDQWPLWFPLNQLSTGMWAKMDSSMAGGMLIKRKYVFDLHVSGSTVSGRLITETEGDTFNVTVPSVNDTAWHYYAISYDSRMLRVYVDSTAVVESPLSGQVLKGSDDDVYIGKNPAQDKKSFAGTIDELSVWHRPVSAAEITALFTGEAIDTNTVSVSLPSFPQVRPAVPAGTLFDHTGRQVTPAQAGTGIYFRVSDDGTRLDKILLNR